VNVEEYISSGILESYIMDELSAAERAEVEKAMSQHQEVRAELDRIEQTMESLAFATAVNPNASLKAKILEEIEFKEETPVVSIDSRREGSSFLKFAAAASVIIALGSAVMAFNYWNKWKNAEDRLSSLIAQNQQFAENYNTVNQKLDNLQESVTVMNSADYERIIMNGTDNAPQSLATVYWNESSREVFLSIQNLKELSEDQQYQLWAIIDGKPVDAGVFDLSKDSFLVQMKEIGSGAAAFAVTIEPKGGSENPTLETMQVLGNV